MTDTTCIWTSPDECVMVRERVLRLLDGSWRCPLHAPRDPLVDLLLSVALASYSGLRNTLLVALTVGALLGDTPYWSTCTTDTECATLEAAVSLGTR